MKVRLLSVIVFSLALTVASAQDANPAPPAAQNSGAPTGAFGQRSGRGGGMGMAGMSMGPGRGLMGTVTQIAADHFTVKTYAGETGTVNFSVNTRFMKQLAGMGQGMGGGMGRGQGQGMPGAMPADGAGAAPQTIKSSDIKVGDDIAAMGEVNAVAHSIGAVMVVQIDPERARQMHEMQANYGKTWIMGKVTAIDGVKVTIFGSVDSAPHAFVADENTTFRRRREPVTMADIHLGDTLRAEGAIEDGVFTATAVNVMGMPPGQTPTVPRPAPPR